MSYAILFFIDVADLQFSTNLLYQKNETNTTIILDCNTNYVKSNKTIALRYRISINGKHGYLTLGKRIKREHYDRDEKKLKPGINNYGQLTAYLRKQESFLDDIFEKAEKSGELLSHATLKDLYEGRTAKVKTTDFYQFVNETIEYERQYSEIKEATLLYYENQLKFIQKFKKKLSVHEINKDFLDKIKRHIKDTGYAENKTYHVFSFLRKYTKKLFDDGRISKYPFADYTIGQPKKTDIDFLMPDELRKLHDLYDSEVICLFPQ